MEEKLSTFANYELGEAFFQIVSKMVVKEGIPFSKIGDFDIVSKEWRKLADKKDKTPEDCKKLDEDYKVEIRDLADSCMIYMGVKTGNKSYKFSFDDYKVFLNIINENNGSFHKNASELIEYEKKIKTEFLKLANHGEEKGDNLVDRFDFAAYIYSLDLKSEHDTNDKFLGFVLNGRITPMNYAIAYQQLKEDKENMISYKLRESYKNLFS